MKRIRLARDKSVGRITLARPEKRNALDRLASDEISEATAALVQDSSINAIVIDADGPDFCAGADIGALRGTLDASIEQHEQDALALGNVFLALHEARCPTIAVVKGRALAGGAGLATACDMILAHEEAAFGYPETRIGFVPAMAMALLIRSVGEKVAFDLATTGRIVGAAEALSIGLISRVFSASNFSAETEAAIAGVASMSASALKETKELLHRLRHMDLRDGIHAGARVNAAARTTSDFRAAVLRFSEKR